MMIYNVAALDSIGLFAIGGTVLLATVAVCVATFIIMTRRRLTKAKQGNKKNKR